jgi:aminoglycoside 3-N-acetyltransferase
MALAAADFKTAFGACGIGAGDLVMLHCDAIVTAQMDTSLPPAARFDMLFDAIQELLGPEGTLVIPTFTYSATKGESFDPSATPSTVGLMTEHFRHRAGVVRTPHPIFSLAVAGRLAGEFATACIDDCFGPDTAFDLLDQHDAWLACLGCSLDRITFTHYVEQKAQVDYRFPKTFVATLMENGQQRTLEVGYYARDLERRTSIDLSRLRARLVERGLLATAPVGRVALAAVRARIFLDMALDLLVEQPSALIAEGAGN